MPLYRAQCTWQVGSEFPRDRIVINPTINDTGLGTDPDGLADDLSFALVNWAAWNNQITVKLYDLGENEPRFPKGEATRNTGQFSESLQPRELALCLSYYADRNAPRHRGRLYLPLGALTTGTAMGARPTAPIMQKAGDLAPVLAGLGGVDVDWVIHSKVDHQTRKIAHWWVDDEWDIVRKRGLRGTTRTSGSTGG